MHAAVGLLPDLGARRLTWACGWPTLSNWLAQIAPLGSTAPAARPDGRNSARNCPGSNREPPEPRPVPRPQAQHVLLLLALRLGDDDDGAEPHRRAHQRQADAGIAGRALPRWCRRGAACPLAIRVADDEERRAVLHRLAGVQELRLAEDLAAGRQGCLREMDQSHQHFDALLAGYVAGTLAEPARLLVRSHLDLSPANRAFVRDLEATGGRMLEDVAPMPLADRDKMLEAIFASPEEEHISVAPKPVSQDAPAGEPGRLHRQGFRRASLEDQASGPARVPHWRDRRLQRKSPVDPRRAGDADPHPSWNRADAGARGRFQRLVRPFRPRRCCLCRRRCRSSSHRRRRRGLPVFRGDRGQPPSYRSGRAVFRPFPARLTRGSPDFSPIFAPRT
jgi:hypothetical protein